MLDSYGEPLDIEDILEEEEADGRHWDTFEDYMNSLIEGEDM